MRISHAQSNACSNIDMSVIFHVCFCKLLDRIYPSVEHLYSWISYVLVSVQDEVAPVLGLSAADFYSETSFGKLMQSPKELFKKNMLQV